MSRTDRATTQQDDAPPPDRSLTLRGRLTRDKLIAAARDVFGRVGFNEVRVTDITADAGVASGTFYTYFDSKEEIFRLVAAQALADMETAAGRDPENTERDLVRDISYATRRYFESVRRNARIARSIEEIHNRETGVGGSRRETLVRGVKRIELWIRRLQERGLCNPQLDPWPTALALHAMNVSVAYDHLVHRDAPEETERLIAAITLIWRATLGL
jgi:AcrR family transcriptional regulator